jgi:hypothetical protein
MYFKKLTDPLTPLPKSSHSKEKKTVEEQSRSLSFSYDEGNNNEKGMIEKFASKNPLSKYVSMNYLYRF